MSYLQISIRVDVMSAPGQCLAYDTYTVNPDGKLSTSGVAAAVGNIVGAWCVAQDTGALPAAAVALGLEPAEDDDAD